MDIIDNIKQTKLKRPKMLELIASEHQEQTAFFDWWYLSKYSKLALAFAIPNGELRNKVVAKRLKTEGVLSGVPDVQILMDKGKSLFIEFKKKDGRLSQNQKLIIPKIKYLGHQVEVCFGWVEAKELVEAYFDQDNI